VRRLSLLLTLVASLNLLAAPLRVEPPSPDSATRFKLMFFAAPCGYPAAGVTVNGRRVDVHVGIRGGVCIDPLQSYMMSVEVGPLPAGTYDVHLDIDTYRATFETTVVVRDAHPLTFAPIAGPIGGGTEVAITRGDLNSWDADSGIALLGGVRSSFDIDYYTEREGSAVRMVTPPARAPGAVDVTVGIGEESWVERSAFIYYDPSQPPDRAYAEAVLFPIAYDGPGAYGSEWRTENRLVPPVVYSTPQFSAPLPQFFTPPCDGCGSILRKALTLPPTSRADGQVVWLLRGTGRDLAASSRIRDVSRPGNAATSVPVVHEDDFRLSFVLPSVPIDARNRVVLRVWSNEPAFVYVYGFAYLVPLQVSVNGLPFAVRDLTPDLARLPRDQGSVDVIVRTDGTGIWPMITVTNNETQQVTIIAPE